MVFAFALVVLSIAPPERADALVPREPGAFAATSTGELWVIERSRGGALLRLTRDGPVEAVPTPLRAPLRVAWSEAAGLWLCSETQVAHRRPDGTWRTVDVPPARGETTALLALAPDHAVLVRLVWEVGSEVLHVSEAGVSRTEALGGDARLETAAADGEGRWWALVHFPGQREGYVEVTDGAWRAWTSDGRWPEGAATPVDFTVAGVADARLGGYSAGFFFAPTRDGFVQRTPLVQLRRVQGDGASRALDAGPSLRVLQALATDLPRGELVTLTGGRESYGLDSFGPTFPLELTRASLDGAERERVPVPLPEWFDRVGRGDVAVAGDVTWVLFDGVVLARSGGAWVALVSSPLQAELAAKQREVRSGLLTDVGLALLGAGLGLGLGALASGAGGAPWFQGGVETLGGGLLALAPALMVAELSPWSHAWNAPGGGLALAFVGLLLAVPATVVAGGLGAWGAGQLAFPASKWGAGLAGALLGSLVGTALYLALDAAFAHVPGGAAFVRSLGVGLVGASATLGYQLLKR